MDLTSIELSGSVISAVTRDGTRVKVRFEPAYLVKTMTGSKERTRWHQNGELVFEEADLEDMDTGILPATCAGGDVGENIYTYRDMVPVPLSSRGRAHCDLALRDSEVRVRISGSSVELVMEDVPKYIEHLRAD